MRISGRASRTGSGIPSILSIRLIGSPIDRNGWAASRGIRSRVGERKVDGGWGDGLVDGRRMGG